MLRSTNCRASGVQGTNDSSIVSKCSMISKHYFKDDFVQHFVYKKQQRSPIINRGYYVRAKAIQKMFEMILAFLDREKNSGSPQVLSLGAGFDSSYFRLKKLGIFPSNGKYFEVDFPEVLQRKLACLRQHPLLKPYIESDMGATSNASFVGKDYAMVGVDLRNVKLLNATLKDLGIDFSAPTLLLSECVLSYLDTESSDELIQWASQAFLNSIFVVYEQVYPFDGFGSVMMKHFESIGSPLKSPPTYPSLMSQQKRFTSLGWSLCEVQCVNCFFCSLPAAERDRINRLELFDEFEEFHLKCSHYVLIAALQGYMEPLGNVLQSGCLNKCADLCPTCRKFSWTFRKHGFTNLKRFGHSMALTKDGKLIVVGGFGECMGKHQRLSGVNVFDLGLQEIDSSYSVENADVLGKRMHSSVVTLSTDDILLFGGRSSPAQAYADAVLIRKVESNKIFCTSIATSGNKPVPRWRHTAVVASKQGIDHVIVFGGRAVGNAVLGDCLELNTSTWTWQLVNDSDGDSKPVPRHSHASVIMSDGCRMIISGGLDAAAEPLSCLYELDLETWAWKEIPLPGLLPRYSHTAHVWKDHLFLIGGVNHLPEHMPGIAVINLSSLTCQEFRLPDQDIEFPIMLHNHCTALDENGGKVIALGGGGNCFSFGTHFNVPAIDINLNQFFSNDDS